MPGEQAAEPDNTAVRVALWRAMHLQVDAPPHVLEDELGLQLAAPEEGWRARPDMDPQATRLFRASIVARARFVEDLVEEQAARGVGQYVILGAGLDTFAQRRPELVARLRVFEIDRPGTQAWKRRRLEELGLALPERLRLVPVDFEAGQDWPERLKASGFDARRPAVVAAAGVSMYLTREAVLATLREVAAFAPGSVLAMTFLVPMEAAAAEVRPGFRPPSAARGPAGRRSSASSSPRRCWRWRAMRASARSGTFRRPPWRSAISPGGATACGPLPAARSSWSRRPERARPEDRAAT